MRILLAVLTVSACLSAKPNFSGKYEADPSSSQRPRAVALRVEHQEPRLRYLIGGAERMQEFILTTDGSDQVRDEPKGEARMSARWDGEVLEIRTFSKQPDRETTSIERWSLGKGGVLTIDTRVSMKPAGTERQFKTVYRKK